MSNVASDNMNTIHRRGECIAVITKTWPAVQEEIESR